MVAARYAVFFLNTRRIFYGFLFQNVRKAAPVDSGGAVA
jgi:hypothetical protein